MIDRLSGSVGIAEARAKVRVGLASRDFRFVAVVRGRDDDETHSARVRSNAGTCDGHFASIILLPACAKFRGFVSLRPEKHGCQGVRFVIALFGEK